MSGRKPLKRSPLKRYVPKPKPEELKLFHSWLAEWPCFVCASRWCAQNEMSIFGLLPDARARAAQWTRQSCGVTEIAHCGVRGLGQRSDDWEVLPLGHKHHARKPDGGGPESHHVYGRGWFPDALKMEPREAFEGLRELYLRETKGVAM
jgi:hypothetical protein